MGLETATYISQLVNTNPTSNDPKSQGDDHLRLLKSVLQSSFPSISGAVTKTHTELNSVTDRGLIAGQTWTGNHTFPDTTYGVTATLGDSSTKFATTEFVTNTSFSFNLPAQATNSGKLLTTDGTNASWTSMKTVNGTSVVGSGAIVIPSNLVLIAEITPTVSANVDFLSTFTSDYDTYMIEGNGINVSTVDDSLVMRLATGGAADSTLKYFYANYSAAATTSSNNIFLQNYTTLAAGKGINFQCFIRNVNSTTTGKSVCSFSEHQKDATPTFAVANFGCYYNNATAVTGFRLYWTGGSSFAAQGKIRVYGVKNT